MKRMSKKNVFVGAAFVGVLALGLWSGGLIALGACAAPMVFGLTPISSAATCAGNRLVMSASFRPSSWPGNSEATCSVRSALICKRSSAPI